ncbi:hypothetical protein OT109_13825 [Phycisphaeraceae bacterium D3-23]
MNVPAACRQTLLGLLPALLLAGPSFGQMEALRDRDDQFIQGMREEGLSDLLGRFVERVGDEDMDPVAKAQLVIAQQEFLASESLARAVELSSQDPAQAEAVFRESRSAYEGLIAAQRQMISDNAQDERVPMWQTDLAAMLLETYLPTYHNNAVWFYEFGIPSPEQTKAYEDNIALAFEMVADARYRLERLVDRMARDGGVLRAELEEMGIFFDLREEYDKRRTPFWYAHCAYYAAQLPNEHPYFQNLGGSQLVRNQAGTVDAERDRLLGQAEAAVLGGLLNDADIATTMRLLAGRVLVASGDPDRVDEGIADYLEAVMTGSADSWQGFLASLAKARGRAATGEMDTATEILNGMARHPFVTQQLVRGNIYPRLLAADLMHRMLLEPAERARGADRTALMAEAYEMPYLGLIADEQNRFAPFLYTRWAEQVGPEEDPASLPPAVRMGIGQMKSSAGAAIANELIRLAQVDPTANYPIPAERQREEQRRAQQRTQAEEDLDRALAFNETLVGEEIDGALRDRGLMNLGFNKYYLAELAKYYGGGGGNADLIERYFEVAQYWATIGIEYPGSPLAEDATTYAVSLLLNFDRMSNTGPGGVTSIRFRDAYRDAADVLFANWPQNDAAHNVRVYTGFYVYELAGDLDKAIEVYGGMPREHPDYYEARRQMILAMQKQYDDVSDEMRQLELTGAAEDNDASRDALARALGQRAEDLERMRRELLTAAEFLELHASEAMENAEDARRRFSAATARAGSLVAIAAMESDGGDAEAALDLLEGFEDDYSPAGGLSNLVAQQANPEQAAAQLDGLIQSAQERRILSLVQSAQLDNEDDLRRIGDAAQAMIEAYPDVAAGVVNGVLRRIEDQIKTFVKAREEALLPVNRADAQKNITNLANVAVQLSRLLVGWAKTNGYAGARLLPFELGMCKALLLAERPGEAIPLMQDWLAMFPNNFDVVMLTGDCIVADARKRGIRTPETLQPGLDLYYKIILFHNAQPGDKPPRFWTAWLKVLETMEYAGGDLAGLIREKVRMLQNRVDPELGGEEFKAPILEIFGRNL